MEFEHEPVLLEEVIKNLAIKKNGIYVDCTIGGAGHSKEIAKKLTSQGHLIGIDQDKVAINAAAQNLKDTAPQIDLMRNNYSQLTTVLRELNISTVAGFLFVLFVASYKIKETETGCSERS